MNWILAHLIGDYLIQNDWMAAGKKRSALICLVHVGTYLVPFLFCSFAWWQLLLIGAEHFAQDRTSVVAWYMKISGKSEFAKPPMAPWSMIVVDNIFHILFIALIDIGRHTTTRGIL